MAPRFMFPSQGPSSVPVSRPRESPSYSILLSPLGADGLLFPPASPLCVCAHHIYLFVRGGHMSGRENLDLSNIYVIEFDGDSNTENMCATRQKSPTEFGPHSLFPARAVCLWAREGHFSCRLNHTALGAFQTDPR